MNPDLVEKLLKANRQFYARYAGSFSTSRYSVQPGVKRLLPELSQTQSLLDVGCGNGNLSLALQKSGFSGQYLGIDFSPNLLSHAQKTDQFRFLTLDLSDPSWSTQLDPKCFDAISCFAVLHHLPGRELQSQTLQNITALLRPDGKLFLSVWQPLNSSKLRERIIPWEKQHFDPSGLDLERELLLDWRAEVQTDSPEIRYVHQFTADELDELAQNAGLIKRDEWLSDGRSGNLALYQIWQGPMEQPHD
jgi:SAM-dependent methyltransferase